MGWFHGRRFGAAGPHRIGLGPLIDDRYPLPRLDPCQSPTTVRARPPRRGSGLLATLALVAAAIAVPVLTGWDTATRRDDEDQSRPCTATGDPGGDAAPAPAIVIALLTWWLATEWAQRLPWRRLLLVSYVVGLAWLLALAYVDGPSGIDRSLGNPYEYLRTARDVDDVGAMLGGFVDRIPYRRRRQLADPCGGPPARRAAVLRRPGPARPRRRPGGRPGR